MVFTQMSLRMKMSRVVEVARYRVAEREKIRIGLELRRLRIQL